MSRILLIPIEKPEVEVKTGDWHQAIYHLLAQEHEVVGVVRPRWQSLKGKRKNLILLWSWLKCLAYGLRVDYDLIYGVNTPSAFIGLLLSLLRHKHLVWDAGNPALFNPGKTQHLFYLMEKLIAKRASKIRMISELYADAYINNGFSKRKMTILPHLVNLELIDQALASSNNVREQIAPDGEKVIMFMGQGSLPTNAEAIKWLNDVVYPTIDAKIIVCGCKPVDDCPNISFMGYVPNIYEYVQACDLAVVPVWKESGAPVPTSRVVDFMACGKPVIVTKFLWEEIPELRDKKNAYIVYISKLEFLFKIKYALYYKEDSLKVGQEARKLIEDKYSWKVADNWVKSLGKKYVASISPK